MFVDLLKIKAKKKKKNREKKIIINFMKYWKITRSFKYQNKKKLIDSAHYNGLEKVALLIRFYTNKLYDRWNI